MIVAPTGEPAGVGEFVYFTGYTLFTRNVGEDRTAGALWRMLSAVGFLTFSLSATS